MVSKDLMAIDVHKDGNSVFLNLTNICEKNDFNKRKYYEIETKLDREEVVTAEELKYYINEKQSKIDTLVGKIIKQLVDVKKVFLELDNGVYLSIYADHDTLLKDVINRFNGLGYKTRVSLDKKPYYLVITI